MADEKVSKAVEFRPISSGDGVQAGLWALRSLNACVSELCVNSQMRTAWSGTGAKWKVAVAVTGCATWTREFVRLAHDLMITVPVQSADGGDGPWPGLVWQAPNRVGTRKCRTVDGHCLQGWFGVTYSFASKMHRRSS